MELYIQIKNAVILEMIEVYFFINLYSNIIDIKIMAAISNTNAVTIYNIQQIKIY